ncbi:hypothetical protein ACQPW1_00340 [Nocardia sp. CA-128927]|uniref:hypothetical protein n=1 Tax=Nocardia sp. CA-128927 TaxID=3239975 RepID=UPI003D9722F6
MTTDLAVAESYTPATMTAAIVSDLQLQVQALDAAYTIAKSLCQTAFAPKDFHGRPEEGAVAILYGSRLGLDAVQSLQNIFVIHGRPSTYAKVMKAAILTAGHELWTVETSATRCVVRGRRKGADPDLPPEESVWDLERVKTAGYDKTNEKYRREPQNMLYARATAECARKVAPEALLGIDMEVNEARDAGPAPVRVRSERVSAADVLGETPPAEASDPEPPAQPPHEAEQPDATAEPDTEPAPLIEPASTTAQQRKLAILLEQHGTTEREDKLEYLGKQFGRTFDSSKELTRVEATQLIEYLSKPAEDDAAETESSDQ